MIAAVVKLDLKIDGLLAGMDDLCLESLARQGQVLLEDLKANLPIASGALHDSCDTKEGKANGMLHTVVGARSDYAKVVGGQEVDTVLYAGVENERLGRWMQTKMDDDQVLDDLAADLQKTIGERLK
jgi:hypothetical protein